MQVRKVHTKRRTWRGHTRAPGSGLPSRYDVLPHIIPFVVPGFEWIYRADHVTYAPAPLRCEAWFDEFANRVVDSCGQRFIPVCRMSDGEFRFCLGEPCPVDQLGLREKVISLRNLIRSRLDGRQRAFSASTLPTVSSGQYSEEEWGQARRSYGRLVGTISRRGYLAMHLSFGNVPFQEPYFPALKRWLHSEGIELRVDNYVPFYFVYALLSGPRRRDLFRGRRVGLVNSANAEKRRRIEESLRREGVSEVVWCSISPDRSFLERIDTSPLQGKVDLCLVGAGVGKPNIILQLEGLGVPCIDAGFMFEVWADPSLARSRPFCGPSHARRGE